MDLKPSRPRVIRGRLPLLAFTCGLLLGLAACSRAEPIPATGTARVRSSPTPVPVLPSALPNVSPSPTSSPRPTATPAPTSTPTRTSTPAPSPTSPSPACLEAGGRIETHQLSTDLAPLPWEFRVYVPPCYDQATERRYPTLILIHGSTFNDDQWDRLGADTIADKLIAAGEIEPFLILMPRDRIWVEPDDDPFGKAVVDHLLPWLDENYRTRRQRQYRAIGGLSRGAAWAVHLGLSRWDLFGAIGAHSLPVFWSDTRKIRGWLAEIPPSAFPRIYLDIGENDYLIESAIWFENLLNEEDVPHEWYLFPGRHEEAYWEAHMESYLRWYAETW